SALLTAGYLLPISIRAFLKETDYEALSNDYWEPRLLMLVQFIFLAAFTLVLGLYPTPLIQLIQNGIAAGLF
ncbi:MAG: proton-conducting membrane transporter, partial [Lachnospiraceae bacterium]|nr:proton-conducting membrane transporter [Lachnospiraceae bacterium]